MYLDYYGLLRDPFSISPDPAFLYPSPQHRQALAHLKYGLDREGGFILLTGEVGTGKTTLTRLLLEQLPGNIRAAYILNAKIDIHDVLASICSELHLDYSEDDSNKKLTDRINRDLLMAHSQGKKTLVVIEEAQNLDPDVLEMLRLLTNLETNTSKLLHILLVGQPELLDLISRNELRQLNQRVISRFHLEPLNLQETTNYLNHRLRRSGGKRALFDSAAIRVIHRLSGGVPRIINLLAERSLLGGYATNRKQVTPAIVLMAEKEVFGNKKAVERLKRPILAAAFLMIFAVIGLGLFWAKVMPDRATSTVSTSVAPNSPDGDTGAPEVSAVGAMAELLPGEEVLVLDEPELAGINDPMPIAKPRLNAYEQLLGVWGIKGRVNSQQQLCDLAGEKGFVCQYEEEITLADLLSLNRPGLVRLNASEDGQYVYLLSQVNGERFLLSNAVEQKEFNQPEFEQQWGGAYLYIWPRLEDYEGPVSPGSRNPAVVAWVQQRLLEVVEGYEYIYNGGVYSSLVVDGVVEFQQQKGLNADGMLGPRTILHLMELVEDMPVLISPQTDSFAAGEG